MDAEDTHVFPKLERGISYYYRHLFAYEDPGSNIITLPSAHITQRCLDLLGKKNEKFETPKESMRYLDCSSKIYKKRKADSENGVEEENEGMTTWTHLHYQHKLNPLTDRIPGTPGHHVVYRY